jgi:uncharacterized Zn finger protein (UPF0148 family)
MSGMGMSYRPADDISSLLETIRADEEYDGLKEGVPEKHQLKIAKDTLKMSDVVARVMGGMTKEEAREVLKKQGWSDDRIAALEEAKKEEHWMKIEPLAGGEWEVTSHGHKADGPFSSRSEAIKARDKLEKEVLDSEANEAKKEDEPDPATQTMPVQEEPDVDAEDLNMEDYEKEDLNDPGKPVKSKTPPEDKAKEVPKAEAEEMNKVKINGSVQEDVWKLETPEEESAIDYLSSISNKALSGDDQSQEILMNLWDENWESIKDKLETEGSTWYVWWMDGVREFARKFGSTNEKIVDAEGRYIVYSNYYGDDTMKTSTDDLAMAKDFIDQRLVPKAKKGEDFWIMDNETGHAVGPGNPKNEALYLCSECHKTFRSTEASCSHCLSNIVEKIHEADYPASYGDWEKLSREERGLSSDKRMVKILKGSHEGKTGEITNTVKGHIDGGRGGEALIYTVKLDSGEKLEYLLRKDFEVLESKANECDSEDKASELFRKARGNGYSREQATQFVARRLKLEAPDVRNMLMRAGVREAIKEAKIREDKCPKCGSDLFAEGNEAGDYMCPECGYDESASEELPDWVTDAIEKYLQAFEAGEVEGARGVEDASVEDTLDFIVSTGLPEQPDGTEFTDEMRAAATKAIEAYGVGRGRPDGDLEDDWDDEDEGLELSNDAVDQVEIGMKLLHDKFDYNVEKTMDFLMSDIVRNLSQEEWAEVERQLNQYVEELGESKKQNEAKGVITDLGFSPTFTSTTGQAAELKIGRYGYWEDRGDGRLEVVDQSDDLDQLSKKYGVSKDSVVPLGKQSAREHKVVEGDGEWTRERVATELMNPLADGIKAMGKGHWFSGERVSEDGALVFEYLSNQAPYMEVHVFPNKLGESKVKEGDALSDLSRAIDESPEEKIINFYQDTCKVDDLDDMKKAILSKAYNDSMFADEALDYFMS